MLILRPDKEGMSGRDLGGHMFDLVMLSWLQLLHFPHKCLFGFFRNRNKTLVL